MVLLRYTLIIATAYLLLAEHQFSSTPTGLIVLIIAALLSNAVLERLPERIRESTAFYAGVILADTLWITAALLYSGRFTADFFYVYFFVLLLAAIGENLLLIAVGAVVTCTAYFFVLSNANATLPVWTYPSLIRIPFLFTAAAFYGYLVDRVRREQQRAYAQADTVAHLEHEILERKRAEQGLQEAKDYAENLINSSLDIIVSADMDRRIVEFNRAAEEAFGYSKAEIIGKHVDVLYANPFESARVHSNLSEHGRFDGEVGNARKNGETFCCHLSVSVLRDANGKVVGTIGTSRDVTEAKRVADELRKLSLAVEQSPAIVIITDAAGNIEYVNPKLTQTTGYGPEEVLGQNPRILKSGETSAEEYQQLWQTITSGAEWRGALHNKRKNGELYWASVWISPIKNSQGVITHFIAIQEDISERKRAEEALRESEERYRTLFENAPIGLGVADLEGNLIAFNDAMLKPGGYSREDIDSIRNVKNLYANLAERAEILAIARERGFVHQHEVQFQRKDGSTYSALLSLSPISMKGQPGWQAMVEDITDRKRAEEALRESEARFRALAEATSDWVWEVDRHGRYTYASPKVRDLLGYEPEEVIGKALFDYMAPAEAERYSRLFQEIVDSQKPFANIENTNLHKDGRYIVLETSGVPIFNADGNFLGYRGIDRDITERKRVEGELKAAQLQLIQSAKFESVGQLAAGVAHEVKNPLAIILQGLTYLSSVSWTTGDDHKVALVLEKLHNAVNRADRVVKDLLDFSAPSTTAVTNADINPVVEQALLLVNHEFIKAHITVVKELGRDLPPLKLDRHKIEQVFVNLFINSVQAMSGGGTLVIKTYVAAPAEFGRRGRRRKADPSATRETLVVIAVEDTGTGIPEDKLNRVFDPFFTTKPPGQGTGLGLSVTRKIMELHGGTIRIANRKEGGVRVSLTFPAEGERTDAAETDHVHQRWAEKHS